jgi:hypothetical protein
MLPFRRESRALWAQETISIVSGDQFAMEVSSVRSGRNSIMLWYERAGGGYGREDKEQNDGKEKITNGDIGET